MIVIATNNGWNYLEQCLSRAIEFGTDNEKILVVDTNSSDKSYIDFAKNICNKYNVEFGQLSYSGYDFGAYMWAYRNYIDDFYFFQHDSIFIKNSESIKKIKSQISENAVCAWVKFSKHVCPFDNIEQQTWLKDKLGTDNYDYGIYGPNFGLLRSTLDRIIDKLNFTVDNKLQQQGMERGWAILFKQLDIIVHGLEDPTSQFNHRFHSDDFLYFTKVKHTPRT